MCPEMKNSGQRTLLPQTNYTVINQLERNAKTKIVPWKFPHFPPGLLIEFLRCGNLRNSPKYIREKSEPARPLLLDISVFFGEALIDKHVNLSTLKRNRGLAFRSLWSDFPREPAGCLGSPSLYVFSIRIFRRLGKMWKAWPFRAGKIPHTTYFSA